MDHILQKSLPGAPWAAAQRAGLPGVQPLEMRQWLRTDEAFAGQMALKSQLFETRRSDVLRVEPGAAPAAAELLEIVCAHLPEGYSVTGSVVTRPDGVEVDVSAYKPLEAAARLVQEDLCILEAQGTEHVLTAAALCFPASWTLVEKIGRPLIRIHAPVEAYTPDTARRVQRLFDGVRPERPLWRQNALLYADPRLYQPQTEAQPRDDRQRARPYLRSERQCLLRLPRSKAVAFTIHTYVVRLDALPEEAQAWARALDDMP